MWKNIFKLFNLDIWTVLPLLRNQLVRIFIHKTLLKLWTFVVDCTPDFSRNKSITLHISRGQKYVTVIFNQKPISFRSTCEIS